MTTIKYMAPVYIDEPPSDQTMIDILAGSWVSSFPPQMRLSAGDTDHFNQNVDTRVKEVAEIYGLRNKSVCELGPLEAYQTKHLCDAGARPVLAVEANNIAFIKCLIVKELFDIPARFVYGSALRHLETIDTVYDVIWASGVLYHQTNPLRLLQLMCDHSKAFYVWSQYWSQNECSKDTTFDPNRDQVQVVNDFTALCHYKSYAVKGAEFSGGVESGAFWMEKPAILDYVASRGFKLLHYKEQPDAPPGPVMLFFAVRT